MLVIIRVDASIQIGTGHVMRCLALAEGLRNRGVKVKFICKQYNDNLFKKIINHGFEVYKISFTEKFNNTKNQEIDAKLSIKLLSKKKADWLIVDSYKLDEKWEKEVKEYCKSLLVIDDLIEKKHFCDILINQNLGSKLINYKSLVPQKCKLLLGPKYSLLRPEFSKLRPISLKHRDNDTRIRKILIMFGGVDYYNYTSAVIEKINLENLPNLETIDVVMGSLSPNIIKVKKSMSLLNCHSKLFIDTPNMANLLSTTDLAIGAAGSTTWERCCLGVPSLQFVIAENQSEIAKALAKSKSAISVENLDQLNVSLKKCIKSKFLISQNCRKITDGNGVENVISFLLDYK